MAYTGVASESGNPAQVERTPGRGLLSEDWVAVLVGAAVVDIVLGVFTWWKAVDLRQFVPTSSSHYRWTADAQIASWTPGWIEALDSINKDARAKTQTKVVEATKRVKDAVA